MSDDSAWLAKLRAKADQPPAALRVSLWAGAALIGSVEPDFLVRALPARCIGPNGWVDVATRSGVNGWVVQGELTSTLRRIADALRVGGFGHAWRDEQLAVRDGAGHVIGSIERGVVRQLGIATHAVHLAGRAPDGQHWVQQRSLTKPDDPGLWDTLMGGMVPASDTLLQALARETWEEAGLRIEQLQAVTHGGRVETRRPSRGEGSAGYVVECIDWYRCVVPEGVVPMNQDGEVAQFARLSTAEVKARLPRDEFTTEAALILVADGSNEG